MIEIEYSIICSVLENDFIRSDPKIAKVQLDPKVFNDPQNRFIVSGINRLKELNEPISTDTLRDKLLQADKWSFSLEERILTIMTSNPFATYELFIKYYNYLESSHDRKKLVDSLYI